MSLHSAILTSQSLQAEMLVPIVHSSTLDNGMMVLTMPDTRATAVNHMVWYRNGSADDPVGKSGIAHFLEHLMFKGTETYPAGALFRQVSRVGGESNAFTTFCYTCYHQTVTSELLGECMSIEADRMRNIRFDDAMVASERDVVLAERGMIIDSNPAALLEEAMMTTVYQGTPYDHAVIGWRREVETLSREDALDYYARFYRPDNAILLVAGDVDHDQVVSMAKATYGLVAPGARSGGQVAHPVIRELRRQRIVHASPSVQQAQLKLLFVIAPSDPVTEALDIIAHYLNTNRANPLRRRLVVGEKHAVDLRASYSPGMYPNVAQFSVQAVPVPGGSLETLEAELDRSLAAFIEEGISEADLELCKVQILVNNIFASDTPNYAARVFGSFVSLGYSVRHLQEWPARLCAVTGDDIRAALRLIDPARGICGYLQRADAATNITDPVQ